MNLLAITQFLGLVSTPLSEEELVAMQSCTHILNLEIFPLIVFSMKRI